MIIGVAGPVSADTAEERLRNLDALNTIAAELVLRGHIPVIGANAGLPVAEKLPKKDQYEAMMKISMALIDQCEALLLIGESPGANRERDLVLAKGLAVYHHIDEIPR